MGSIVAKVGVAEPCEALAAGSNAPLRRGLGAVAGRAAGWLRAHLEHPTTRPVPPLELELSQGRVHFYSLREFEFAVTGRTEIPAQRVHALLACTTQELDSAAERLRDTERHFADALARAVREPSLVSEFFCELDLGMVSRDHDWRDIVEGLMRRSPEFDPYKHLTLVKYAQYLRSRQHLLGQLSDARLRDADAAKQEADGPLAVAGGSLALHRDASRHHASAADHRFRMLPKGETVHLHLDRRQCAELLLAGHSMRLHVGRQSYLVDDNGKHPLAPGKNLVGRHSSCDVVVARARRSVSRTHLLIEMLSDKEALLTDLSAHGTEIPAELLRTR